MSNNNEVEIIGADITDITARQQESSGLLDYNTDHILYMAEKAEKYVEAINRTMDAALKITNERDWVIIGDGVYLQETGSTKIARMFGISIQLVGAPIVECDNEGYKTFTYKARFMLKGQFIECEGSRSMKDDFFAKQGKDKPIKKPDEIEERDVKMAAYTNCINNGIKRLIPGLRGLDLATLERAGFNTAEIRGYTFKTGSKGGNSGKAEDSGLVCAKCGAAITQKVAAYSMQKFGSQLCYECQKGATGV